jgi:hypothetical protein
LRLGGYGENMLDIRPGDYVECVDNSPRSPISAIMPEGDRLYTVEEVRFIAGGYSLRLNELAPSCYMGGPCACGDCGWDARRFRRVYRPEARKLELFKAMLRMPKLAIADPVPIDN